MAGKFALVLILCLSLAVLNVTSTPNANVSAANSTEAPTSRTTRNGTSGTDTRLAQSGVVALVLLPIALHP